MCNRIRRVSKAKLQSLFGDIVVTEALGIEEELTFGYDRPLMTVLSSYPDVKLEDMEWGYLPHEATGKPELQAKLGTILNARAESIFEKFAFKNSIMFRRCIIPLDGFYEYQHNIDGKGKKVKTPFYVSLEDNIMFAAGIWDICEGRKTFAIITTKANPLMQSIHNSAERQPHIIERKDWERWFNPALTKDEIAAMLSNIYPDDSMKAEQYEMPETKAKKARNEKPADPKEPPTLF